MNPYLSYSENDLPSLAVTLQFVLASLSVDPVTVYQLLDIDFVYFADIAEIQELVKMFYDFRQAVNEKKVPTSELDNMYQALTANLDTQLDFIDDVGKHYDDMKKLDNDPE